MKIFIKTYGCQANVNDSEIISGILAKNGYELAENEEDADYIILNSCSVKNKTQSKIIDYIRKHKDKKIIATGCLTKTIDIKKFGKNVYVKHFLNNKNKINLPIVRNKKDTAIIQISQGCLNACTFCATKIAKGALKSYGIRDIKRAFEKAVAERCKIIYLTSQDNGCYGFDIGTNLPELLKELISVKGNYKIRIGMMNPWHLRKIKKELFEVIKNRRIIKFLHIPVQSGSEKVLENMKRMHSVKEFEKIAEEFRKKFPRKKFPDSTIATDIIVGYPTEKEEDFEQTLKLIKKVKPEVLNISAFSSRPKTPASKLKQLSSEVIKERTRRLNKLYWEYRKKIKIHNPKYS